MTKKNERTFNVSVLLDGATYQPGEPVKIGKSKGAISVEEADDIERVHGVFGGVHTAKVSPDTSKLEADLTAALARAEKAEEQVVDLQKQIDELTASAGGADE